VIAKYSSTVSPAVRGRGLKRNRPIVDRVPGVVARRARAWIETFLLMQALSKAEVARRARAWIETITAR